MTFSAVFLDMDGLLLDSEELSYQCWREVCARDEVVLTREIFARVIGTSSEESHRILREAFGDNFPAEEYRAKKTALFTQKIQEEGIRLKPGASEILSYCAEAQIPLAVVTGTKDPEASARLTAAKIRDKVKCLFTGDLVRQVKPAPDLYLLACATLGVSPQSCITCEDSPSGVGAALDAGIPTVWIPDMQTTLPATLEKRIVGTCKTLEQFMTDYLLSKKGASAIAK